METPILNPEMCFPLKKSQKPEGVSMALNILDTFTLLEFMLTTRGLNKFQERSFFELLPDFKFVFKKLHRKTTVTGKFINEQFCMTAHDSMYSPTCIKQASTG